ncbi:MAG: NCS2 family permease [Acidobacteria bacterium]|nr:NCS2 family permease [Acidobacteriota bacterium]
METFFHLRERGSSVRTECLAGLTTFLTMAYIVFVNPGILAAAGVPFAGAATATAIGAGLMCIAMGLATNLPIAMAPGMGLNAALAFSVIGVAQAYAPWQAGMAVILAEGLIMLVLVATGLREAVMNAIPLDLKRAIGVGIGLFIALIGLNQGGLIRPAPITLVTLGDFRSPVVWVTVLGLVAVLALMALRVKGAILWALLLATLAALVLGLARLPTALAAAPRFETFFAPFQRVGGTLALARLLEPVLLMGVFAILLTDFFDTMGSVVAIGEQAGFVEKDGRVPGIQRILTVDASAAATGGLFGCSSITCYIESAAGIAAGGRTGLGPIVAGLLFLLSAFFTPLIELVGGGVQVPNSTHYTLFAKGGFQVAQGSAFLYPVTAGVLIVVGFLMMQTARELDWGALETGFPAFLILLGIPLTYSIAHGIGLGFLSHVLIMAFRGRAREVHPLMWGFSAAFLALFLWHSFGGGH